MPSYRPGLDGLRAIAVALVMAFHLGHLSGGILGVDAFFVVSGWLITWKLLSEIDASSTVDLRRFWASRARRLMPASLLVIAFVAVAWPLASIPVPSLRHDILWSLAWSSNWGTITGGGDYWARFSNPSPMSHFWSLAIEEQYYLVWPAVLWLLARRRQHHRRTVGVLAAVGAGASIAFMATWFDPLSPTSTYMNTGARAHSLLIGAAAAAFTRQLPDGSLRGGRTARWLAPLAVIIATAIVVRAEDNSVWLFRWGFALFAVVMTVVVVAAADGVGERLLGSRPLRWIGDRSYGLYLWHWPIFLLMSTERVHLRGVWLDIARVLMSLAVAHLSLHYLEEPIRSRRWPRVRAAPIALAMSMVGVVALALVVVPDATAGPSATVITLPPAAPTSTTDAAGITPDTRSTATTAGTVDIADTAGTVDTTAAPAAPVGPVGPVRVLVAGDSTAVQLGDALVLYAAAHPAEIVAGSAAFPGCGLSASDDGRLHQFTNEQGQPDVLSLEGCLSEWAAIVRRVPEEQIDIVLVNIGAWDAVDMLLTDGRLVSVADPVGGALIAEVYRAFVDDVERAGAAVVWVTPPDADLQWDRVDSPLDDPARWAALRAIIQSLPVEQIDLPSWLAEQGLAGPDGRPDGVHLADGVNTEFVATIVAPTLVRMHTAATR